MHCKRQLTRDGIRCRAFEQTEQEAVFTIDKNHHVRQGEEGRHICHDFTQPGVLRCMDRQWSGQVFRHVIMDYFYTPGSWHEERWNEAMYSVTLPIMAAKGAIPINGEVWLPNIDCISDRLHRLSDSLQPWFTTHMISNPMENPLYKATQTVATELTEDGNSFTNESAMRSLPAEFPFIVLRCIKSGTSIGPQQRPGCGSLLDIGIGDATGRLRPRLLPLHHYQNKNERRKLSILNDVSRV